MKTFRFTLEAVLAHRRRIEDGWKSVVIVRRQELDAAQAQLDALHARYREFGDRLRGAHGSLTGEDLRLHHAQIALLDRTIDAQADVVDRHRAAVDRSRAEAIEASKQRKALEKLEECRREAHDVEIRRLEQNELDEANARTQEYPGLRR